MLIEHLNEGITNLLLSEPAFVVKDHLSFSHGILSFLLIILKLMLFVVRGLWYIHLKRFLSGTKAVKIGKISSYALAIISVVSRFPVNSSELFFGKFQ